MRDADYPIKPQQLNRYGRAVESRAPSKTGGPDHRVQVRSFATHLFRLQRMATTPQPVVAAMAAGRQQPKHQPGHPLAQCHWSSNNEINAAFCRRRPATSDNAGTYTPQRSRVCGSEHRAQHARRGAKISGHQIRIPRPLTKFQNVCWIGPQLEQRPTVVTGRGPNEHAAIPPRPIHTGCDKSEAANAMHRTVHGRQNDAIREIDGESSSRNGELNSFFDNALLLNTKTADTIWRTVSQQQTVTDASHATFLDPFSIRDPIH